MPSDLTPPTLEYRTPYSGQRRTVFSVGTCAAGFFVLGMATFAFCFIVPKFEQIFKDFGAKLPPITQMLLQVSRWFANDYGWAILWPMPVVFGFVVPLLSPSNQSVGGRRRSMFQFSAMTIAFLLMAAIVLLVALGLFMPYVSLINAVSSPKK